MKKILGIIICAILIFGLIQCGKDSDEKKEKSKDEANSQTFKVDYVSLSFAGVFDIVDSGLTNERYFEVNPSKKEENLADNDYVSVFVFASLSAMESNKEDLNLPKSKYDESIPANRLNLGLFFSENTQKYYRSSYELNDYRHKLTNLWSKYESGSYLDDNYILYAGSGESIYIVGEFDVKYHDIKEAIQNNSTITLNWDNKYQATFKGKEIDKNLSINDIQTTLKNKGLI